MHRRSVVVASLVLVASCGEPDPAGDAATDAAARADGSAATRGILFASDWSTALGTSAMAVLDTDRTLPWSAATSAFEPGGSEVVAADGLGFPPSMVNVLRTGANDGSEDISFEASDAYFDPPPVGGSLYYRLYVRVDVPDTVSGDLSWHPWQDTYGDGNWVGQVETFEDGTWSWRVQLDTDVNEWPEYRWGDDTRLSIGEVYRLEWQLERTGADTVRLHMRVYDATDALVVDDDDIHCVQPGCESLASFNAGGGQLVLNDLGQLPGLTVGVNGFSDNGGDYTFSYTGGVCIRDDVWCGPYSPDEVR